MSVKEKLFYEAETEFFEKITAISGEMTPKQPKGEKKEIIKSWLIKYQKEIPHNVYLPTNPHCKVLDIDVNSGTPMQSAE